MVDRQPMTKADENERASEDIYAWVIPGLAA